MDGLEEVRDVPLHVLTPSAAHLIGISLEKMYNEPHNDGGWRGVLAFVGHLLFALLIATVLTFMIADITGMTDGFINSYKY